MTVKKQPAKTSATKTKKEVEDSAAAVGLDENHPAVKRGLVKNVGSHLPEDQDPEQES